MTWEQIRDEIAEKLKDIPEEHLALAKEVAEDAARLATRAVAGDPPSDAEIAHVRAQALNLGSVAQATVVNGVLDTIGAILQRVVLAALAV